MNYWFLYKLDTGEIYGAPYLGSVEEWSNVPDGCGVIGPFPVDSAPLEVVDAFQNPQYYLVQDEKLVQIPNYADKVLLDMKNMRINDLNTKCNQTILSGFTSYALGEPHQYDFDEEAQRNFNGTLTMLTVDPTISTIVWKTVDAGPLPHTKDQFIQLCKDGFAFKQNMISKYWLLKTKVQQATTIDEVNAITWGDPIPPASTPIPSMPF